MKMFKYIILWISCIIFACRALVRISRDSKIIISEEDDSPYTTKVIVKHTVEDMVMHTLVDLSLDRTPYRKTTQMKTIITISYTNKTHINIIDTIPLPINKTDSVKEFKTLKDDELLIITIRKKSGGFEETEKQCELMVNPYHCKFGTNEIIFGGGCKIFCTGCTIPESPTQNLDDYIFTSDGICPVINKVLMMSITEVGKRVPFQENRYTDLKDCWSIPQVAIFEYLSFKHLDLESENVSFVRTFGWIANNQIFIKNGEFGYVLNKTVMTDSGRTCKLGYFNSDANGNAIGPILFDEYYRPSDEFEWIHNDG